MEENENNPVLLSSKPLRSEFAKAQKIAITSGDFTLGRSLKNSVCIPFLSISRNHCTFKKLGENEWYVEDNSSLGIKVNNEKLGQGSKRKLEHEDLISLEPTDEFIYKFILPSDDVFETPRKRIKMIEPDSTIINNVKLKFEESQKCEIQHIAEKIQNAKQMQTTSITLKKQLQEDMNRKIQHLENEFSIQIENLKGEKNEVEKQKASLIEERDAQLSSVKHDMEGKIAELMEQINKHNETESELLKENGLLKDKLKKEQEDFLAELNRESSSKQDMLDKLEAKICEQEEIRVREKQELEDTLRRETEQLRLAKEKELQELEELKRQREIELEQELNNIKKNLADQVEQTKQQRVKAENELKLQTERMKKLQAEEKTKMEQFQKEREEIQKKLTEAQIDAEKSKVEVQARVIERETELAALAAERIQKQVDQSSEVISTLQEQLEKVKSQLQTVETEKNTLLENMEPAGEGTSKQDTLNQFGDIMESELQCSICAELFVESTTLNCSHTFCKYCISMWKKKKRDCPICRAPITSECKSLALDTFIERMVQSLTDVMKTKRQEMLAFRAAEVRNSRLATMNMSKRRKRTITTRTISTTITIPSGPTSGATTRHRTTATVDLTNLPTPMSPAEQPPMLPQTAMHHPLQLSHQFQTANLTTQRQVPSLDLTTAVSNLTTTNTGEVPQISTAGGSMLSTPTNGTERQHAIHPHSQSVQENLTLHRIGTGDPTTPPSQTPTETHQISTERTGRQIMTADAPTPRMNTAETPPVQGPVLVQILRGNGPIANGMRVVGRLPATQHRNRLRQQGRQIQTEVLTLAIPMKPGERPPAGAPIRLLRLAPLQGLGTSARLGVEGGVVTSPASRAPTSAATDDASPAVTADTGPPAAPSDNQDQP